MELRQQTVAAATDPDLERDHYAAALQMDYTLGYLISYATKRTNDYLGGDAEKHGTKVVFGVIRGLFTGQIGEHLLAQMQECAAAPTVDFWDGYSTAAAEIDEQRLGRNEPSALKTFLSSGGTIRVSL